MGHPQGGSVLLAQIVGFNYVHYKTSLCLYLSPAALRPHEGGLKISLLFPSRLDSGKRGAII